MADSLELVLDLILRSREAASRRMGGCIMASWFETAQERLLTMRSNTDLLSCISKRRPA